MILQSVYQCPDCGWKPRPNAINWDSLFCDQCAGEMASIYEFKGKPTKQQVKQIHEMNANIFAEFDDLTGATYNLNFNNDSEVADLANWIEKALKTIGVDTESLRVSAYQKLLNQLFNATHDKFRPYLVYLAENDREFLADLVLEKISKIDEETANEEVDVAVYRAETKLERLTKLLEVLKAKN